VSATSRSSECILAGFPAALLSAASISVITTDPANNERLFRHLQAEKREGVVFKRLGAPYIPNPPET
jgi:ATP-dependent DNA ligase